MDKDYTVLAIDELSRMGDLGGIEKYYRYRIKTKGGTVISVNIDEADSTEEKAPPILAAKAKMFDGIKKS